MRRDILIATLCVLCLANSAFAQMSGGKVNRVRMKPTFYNEFFMTADISYSMVETYTTDIPQFSFGVSLGKVKRFGWYITVMSNFNFKGMDTDYSCDKYGLVNITLPFYSGERSCTRISAMGGVAFRTLPWWQLHLGVGYGYKSVFWKTKDNQWIKVTNYSCQGLAMEIGTGFRIKGFFLSAGVVTTGFNFYEAKLGFGCSLR